MQDNQGDLEQALLAARPDAGAALPQHWPGLDQGYAVQRRIAARSTLPVMVWKLGLTSEGARDAFGASEPIVGRLSASAIYSDNSDMAFCGPQMFAEAEVVFEMGRDLPERPGPYTREDICAAIKGIYGGIEIVRSRFVSSNLPLPLLIADNVMAHGLVLGRRLATGWEDRFADMPVTLTRNAEPPVEGSAARVMDNPLDAVVWLANWLRDNEQGTLRREQLVASGSCTGATEIFTGDTITVHLDGAQAARVTMRVQNEKEERQ